MKTLCTVRELGQHIETLTYSPDNKRTAIAFDNGICKLYDEKLNEIVEFRGFSAPVEHLEFHPEKQKLLMLADSEIYLWHLDINGSLFTKEYRYRVKRVQYAPSEPKFLFTQGGLFHVVHEKDSRRDIDKRWENGWVTASVFSNDGKKVAVGGEDACIRIFEYEMNTEPILLKGVRAEEIRERFEERLYKLTQGDLEDLPESVAEAKSPGFRPTAELKDFIADIKGHLGEITILASSPDGKHFASSSTDSKIKIWSWEGELITTIKGFKSMGEIHDILDQGFEQSMMQQQQSIDNPPLIFEKMNELAEVDPLKKQGHTETVNDLSFSPDGKYLFSVSDDGTLRKWTLKGKLLWTQKLIDWGLTELIGSKDGSMVFTGDNSGMLTCLDSDSGEKLWAEKAHKSSFLSLNISPNGQWIISSGSDRQTFIWDLMGKKYLELEGHSSNVNDASFSPDNQYVLTASDDKTIRKWLIDPVVILGKAEEAKLYGGVDKV